MKHKMKIAMIKNENHFHSIIAAGSSAIPFSMYIDAKLTDDVFKYSNIYISTAWILVAYENMMFPESDKVSR